MFDFSLRTQLSSRKCGSSSCPLSFVVLLLYKHLQATVSSQTVQLCSPYLGAPLLIQLHRHERRCSLLTDGGVAALPEKVTALLLPGC